MNTTYNSVASATSKQLTEAYSTSFSSASKLFPKEMRPHIYAIYGLVRLADEIVDTYKDVSSLELLNDLEAEVYAAITRRYSTNLLVHSFALTAGQFGIGRELIAPFFESMRIDAPGSTYLVSDYQKYIHGSAEVVGLMCLKVFCGGKPNQYKRLQPGAMALGAAFQKVNFLRDLAEDHKTLGRYYFPVSSFKDFNDNVKGQIITDIERDFKAAKNAIDQLPTGVRPAVTLAYLYYQKLLSKLSKTPAQEIKKHRVRMSDATKAWLLLKVKIDIL